MAKASDTPRPRDERPAPAPGLPGSADGAPRPGAPEPRDESEATRILRSVGPFRGDDEEIRMLWRRFRASGDPAARERLVLSYSPLVRYVVGRLMSNLPSHIEQADLTSYGLMGLLSAIDRFEPDRGVRFESYAMTRIKGAIIDELRTLDWAPRSLRMRARQIEQAGLRLEHRLHRAPTEDELAEALGIPAAELRDDLARIASSTILALDDAWGLSTGGETTTLGETVREEGADPADIHASGEVRAALADAIARLPEKEKIVIALYYYDNLTLKEIGDVLGVTESRVSQLRAKAVLALRGRLRDAAGAVG
ncbi:MAG: FliA/WhiG family RNA polymerase sigma factor [Actinomycetota bacterium]